MGGGGKPQSQLLGHRIVGAERHAQVPDHRPFEPIQVLVPEGSIEAVVRLEPLKGRTVREVAVHLPDQEQLRDVARQEVEKAEAEHRQRQQQECSVQQTARQGGDHGTSRGAPVPGTLLSPNCECVSFAYKAPHKRADGVGCRRRAPSTCSGHWPRPGELRHHAKMKSAPRRATDS